MLGNKAGPEQQGTLGAGRTIQDIKPGLEFFSYKNHYAALLINVLQVSL